MKQLRSLRSLQPELDAAETKVVAITGDSPQRIRAFKEREGIAFDILSDPSGDAFRALGVARRGTIKGKPYAHPATIVLDREGKARLVDVRKVLFAWRPSEAKLLEVARSL